MKFFNKFLQGLQQDLKAFVFWCVIFTIFRALFICAYSSQLAEIYTQLADAMLLGFRLSMKTAGMLCVIGFALATLPGIFIKQEWSNKIRLAWHKLALVFFTLCFFARISYYKIFNSGFNMMLINGMHDDIYATFMTAVQEYQLWWRLPVAVVVGIVLGYAFKEFLERTPIFIATKKNFKFVIPILIIFLPVLCVFTRYGGAFNYAGSVNWESAGRFNSNLLNEAVLDDGQALYRVHSMKKRLDKVTNVNISSNELRKKIAIVGGNPDANTIDDAFVRTVKAPKRTEKPDNIVLVIGESFGEWPFLPTFKDLGLVEQTMSLKNAPNSAHVNTMLANGDGTMTSLNGIISGLPSSGLYENYQPKTFEAKYQMGLGYIMKQLGYKTVFWYGGFSGWQNIKNYALAQSFDEFHCADEFASEGGNAWGCSDKQLFTEINKYIAKEQQGEKVFHAILTTSNHPPYTIDVQKEGFDAAAVKAKLTDDISSEDNIINELGHIWYADKTTGEFIKEAEKLSPKSVFIITGDHSERFTFAKEQNARTLSAIPCIFYGYQITPELLQDAKVGCHMQLAGTLAEIYGVAGMQYSSMLPSMFECSEVFNYKLYGNKDTMEQLSKHADMQQKADNARSIAAWRTLKGNEM